MLVRNLYILFFFLLVSTGELYAQADELNPVATLLRENGKEPESPVVLAPGDEYAGAAPLEFEFSANMDNTSDIRFEWNFAEDPEFNSIFMVRFDEVTNFTFNHSGKFYIRLLATNTATGNELIPAAPFMIQIAESELKVPNAFSPNGDGINDVFKVTYKSLVKFKAVVFNIWGQKLYEWGLSDIDKGWDGSAGGRQVPEGVYYIMVEALGADGVKYNHKGDINILR